MSDRLRPPDPRPQGRRRGRRQRPPPPAAGRRPPGAGVPARDPGDDRPRRGLPGRPGRGRVGIARRHHHQLAPGRHLRAAQADATSVDARHAAWTRAVERSRGWAPRERTDGASHGRPLQQLMVLAGLTGFAISQPLLSVLGDNPTTLALHGIEGIELVALAAGDRAGPAARPVGHRPPRLRRIAAGRSSAPRRPGRRSRRADRHPGREERRARSNEGSCSSWRRRPASPSRWPTRRVTAVATWASYTAILPGAGRGVLPRRVAGVGPADHRGRSPPPPPPAEATSPRW